MATMKSETAGSIRIGPVTLISLVVILCLAVLSVLAVTTARASSAQADRQRAFISSTYSNDFAAQKYLAEIDQALYEAGQDGLGADDAMAYVRAASPEAASIEGRRIRLAFATDVGRRLTIEVQVNDDLTFTVNQWTASTDWTEEEQETNLWDGE